MNKEDPLCRRCDTPMHIGFVADNADSGYLLQAKWVEGLPENSKLFGMNTGTLQVKGRLTLPLLAYRCPVCSCVEFFAFAADHAQEMLLRPASGEPAQNADQLLRGSESPRIGS